MLEIQLGVSEIMIFVQGQDILLLPRPCSCLRGGVGGGGGGGGVGYLSLFGS